MLDVDLTATEWQERAACAGLDDLFSGQKPEPDERETIQRICASCPVRDECAAYALAETVTWGVWAGVWRGPGKHALTAAA